MTITIISRKRFCTRVFELLESMGGHFIHSVSGMYGSDEVAIFVFTGDENACKDVERYIRGTYITGDVLVLPIASSYAIER